MFTLQVHLGQVRYGSMHQSNASLRPLSASTPGDKATGEFTPSTDLEWNEPLPSPNRVFKVADIVRIYRWKSHFEKGYTKRWTNELYKIIYVIDTVPWTYK